MSVSRCGSNCGKYSTLLGLFLVMFPLVYATTWGNISVYVNSYLWQHLGITSGLTTPWIVSFYIISMNLGSYADGMVRKMDKRMTAALGVVSYDLGILAHFWLVQSQHAIVLLLVAVVFVGVGAGLLLCVASRFVADWYDAQNRGRGVSVFYSGICFGNALINPLITLYVNPDNLSPNAKLGHLKLFTQPSVVNKAPSIFLVLGGGSLVCHILGLLLLRQKPSGKDQSNQPSLTYGSSTFESAHLDGSAPCESGLGENQGTLNYPTQTDHFPKISSRSKSGSSTDNNSENKDTRETRLYGYFKSRELYSLWFVFFCVEHVYIHQANYYKEYGQARIPDHHFLSDLTIPIGVIGGVHRIAWGFVMDRHGIKTDLILLTAAGVISPLTAYFTAMADKWLYMISASLFFCVRMSITPTFLVAASVYFDPSQYSVCYGLITSGAIVCNITAPPMFSFLLGTYSWFSSFAAVSVLSLVGLLASTLALPKPQQRNNKS